MFHRQRILAEFLQQSARPVSKIELMKWAFLLKMEASSRGGSSFYEFVPYTYGPYSFSLTRDANQMVDDGLLTTTEKTWGLVPNIKRLLPYEELQADVKRILVRYGQVTQNDLIKYVYQVHPTYTVNSKIQKLASRAVALPAIYTVGYEGRQLDGFLDLLVQTGVQRLVDVRRNPVSRRFGFHKSTLTRHCQLLQIEYLHLPELGIATEQRSHLSATRDYDELFENYEQTTLATQTPSVKQIADWMKQSPTAIMCMERMACECHRSRLANRLREFCSLPIIHLQ